MNSFQPDQFKRLQPIHLIENCLKSNVRPDGRSLHDARPIRSESGSISSAHGSATVSFGNTSVVCGIKFEIAEPELIRPNQGFIVPNVDLGPMCCAKYRAGPPNDESQLLSSRLRDVLLSSDLLPSESLVIEPGKFVWVVYIDLVCLSNDGNLFDPLLMSATMALKNARKPLVRYDPDENKVALENPESPQSAPLQIDASIHSSSFAIFDNSLILPDPTLFEEEYAAGFLTIVIDHKSQIRHVWFSGDNHEHHHLYTDDNAPLAPHVVAAGGVLQYPKILEFCYDFAKKKKSNSS